MSRISDLAGFTTALSTTEDLSVGIITASSFSGDGSGLTGVGATDNIQTATSAKFLSNVNVSGITTLASVNVSGSTTTSTLLVTGITTVGVVTAATSVKSGVFYGPLTGNVTGDVTGDLTGNADTATSATSATNAAGLTGTPSITVATVSAAVVNTTGDVSIGGSLTVNGEMTTINSVELNIEDKLVGIASTSSPTDQTCDGAGLQIFGSTHKTFTWERDTGCFEYSEPNKFKGVIETVATASTSNDANGRLIVECDLAEATTFTHAMAAGAGGQIGIVSFKNMPADSGVQNGTTATIIFTQSSTLPQNGVGNTQFPAGIGTFITVKGFEDGSAVAGINTTALVAASAGSASTVFLSNIQSQRDFVSFFIHYNGGTNTVANSYQVYATKNGNFAQGNLTV